MTEITTIDRDALTGQKVGRCGKWYVRARSGGSSFDLASPPFKSWDEAEAEFTGLTIDQTSRLLGVPKGELYAWGRG